MRGVSLDIEKMHVLQIDPGEDVLECVKQFLKDQEIEQAVVTGGFGTLAAYHLHWVKHNRLPTENVFAAGEDGIEILAMNGMVTDGDPHIHVTLSTQNGAFGGHLENGCIAYVLCEIFFAEVSGKTVHNRTVPIEIEEMGKGKYIKLVVDEEE